MQLGNILKLGRHYDGGLEALASAAGVTERGLYNSASTNKVAATTLEKLSRCLGVNVAVFFDEDVRDYPMPTPEEMEAAASKEAVYTGETEAKGSGRILLAERMRYVEKISSLEKLLLERERVIDALEKLLAEKERVLAEKERLISHLTGKPEMK